MGGSPCGEPKRSASGKKSVGATLGRYEARPAARAAWVHNDTHTETMLARTNPATRRLEAANGRRAMKLLNVERLAPEGTSVPSNFECKGGCRRWQPRPDPNVNWHPMRLSSPNKIGRT